MNETSKPYHRTAKAKIGTLIDVGITYCVRYVWQRWMDKDVQHAVFCRFRAANQVFICIYNQLQFVVEMVLTRIA